MRVHTVLLIVLIVALAWTSVLAKKKSNKNHHVNKCITHCIANRGHSRNYCELHCESSDTDIRTLSIYDEGVLVSPYNPDGTLSEFGQTLNIPRVRFDKALFNTPSAFDELVKWTHVLKQQIAVEAERVFQTHDGTQFHFLPMPIPLSPDQLNSPEFMNRLVDVVPASDMVFKETSPLTFSEAYRQFLLDVKIDQTEGSHTPEQSQHIQHLENIIQNDMNNFLAAGDRCYAAYEHHLAANNLKRISYTFDSFASSNGECIAADNHMIAHEQHSKELAAYLDSLNPSDELFRAIGKQSESSAQGWQYNKEMIQQFANEHAHLEASGAAMPTSFKIIMNMMRYYFKEEVFGGSTQMEESCLNAHLDFNALGWKEISVNPNSWFSQSVLDRYRHRPTNSGRNYFGQGGVLQRMLSKLVIAYKPTLVFTVTSAMKMRFVEHAAQRNYRPLELGPFVYDRVDFRGTSEANMIDQYVMTLTSNTQDPQVVGYKTRAFSDLHIDKASTNEFAYCRRESACQTNTINLVALHAYIQQTLPFDHHYTANWEELGQGAGGYRYEGVLGYCFPTQQPGTTALHRYYNPTTRKRMFATNYGELGGGGNGWNYEGVVCYVYQNQEPGTQPLYRWTNPMNDRIFTTNANKPNNPPFQPIGYPGHPQFHMMISVFQRIIQFQQEGIIGFLHTQSAINQYIACCKCD